MAAPPVIAGKQTVDVFNQWQNGEATAGDLFSSLGNTLGSGYGAKANMRANRNAANTTSTTAPEFGVRTQQDPKMAPGQIEIVGFERGVPTVRHGGGVTEFDLNLHRNMAWQSGNDAVNQFKGDINPLNRLGGLFGGKPQQNQQPRVGTLGYEMGRENLKHQERANNALAQANELRQKGDIAGAEQLERQARQYRQQAQNYVEIALDPAQRNQRGDGYVANDRLTPQELTEKYGKVHGPIPTSVSGPTGIKEFEHVDRDRSKPVIQNPELQILEPGQRALPLEVGKEYLWVIDREGQLRIGTETVLDPD